MDDPRPILVYHDVVSDTVVDKFKAAAISEVREEAF